MVLAGYQRSPAVVQSASGIIAGILGGWLTGHWLWAPVCGLLVLIGAVAVTRVFNARRESGSEGGTFTAINRDLETVKRGTVGIAGIVALLALGMAIGGTLYFSVQDSFPVLESPQGLAADGSHSSPDAAVKGFTGDAFLGDGPGACGYVIPDEQQACIDAYNQGNGQIPSTQGTSLGTAAPVVNGALALVPIVGKLCESGSCQSFTATGLPPGNSFQQAFQHAYNTNGNLMQCQEIGGAWYVVPPPPSSQGF